MSISFPTPNGPIRLTGPVAAFLRRSQTGGSPPPAADLAAGTQVAKEYLARVVRPEYVPLPFRGPHDLDNWTGETWEIRRAYRALLLKEPAVKAALKSKVAAVASLTPQVLPEDKANPRDVAAARFVDWAVARSHGGWPGVVRAITAGALIDGFSVCEKVLAPVTARAWPGFWGLEELAPLDTRYIRLDVDPYKRVTAVRYVKGQASQAFDPRDFTVYAYQALWGSPFGISDLRAAYRPAALIEAAVRLRAVLLENFAGPFLVGTYQAGDQGQKEELLAVLREARATGYVVVPDGDEVTVLNLATSADAQFGAAIEDYRKEIYTAIRGAYLPFSEGAAGARVGNSQVHQDTTDLDAWDLAVDVAEVVNRQLVPDLVRPNFGEGVGLPRVTFGARDPDAALKTLEIVKAVQAAGVPVSAAYVYEASGVEPPAGPDDVAGAGYPGEPTRPAPPPPDRTFAVPYDEAKHPRDDRGRWVKRSDIQAAARDPEVAARLRAEVTAPAERAKLDARIAAATPPPANGTGQGGLGWDAIRAGATAAARGVAGAALGAGAGLVNRAAGDPVGQVVEQGAGAAVDAVRGGVETGTQAARQAGQAIDRLARDTAAAADRFRGRAADALFGLRDRTQAAIERIKEWKEDAYHELRRATGVTDEALWFSPNGDRSLIGELVSDLVIGVMARVAQQADEAGKLLQGDFSGSQRSDAAHKIGAVTGTLPYVALKWITRQLQSAGISNSYSDLVELERLGEQLDPAAYARGRDAAGLLDEAIFTLLPIHKLTGPLKEVLERAMRARAARRAIPGPGIGAKPNPFDDTHWWTPKKRQPQPHGERSPDIGSKPPKVKPPPEPAPKPPVDLAPPEWATLKPNTRRKTKESVGNLERSMGNNRMPQPSADHVGHHVIPGSVYDKLPMLKKIGFRIDHYTNGWWVLKSLHPGRHAAYTKAIRNILSEIPIPKTLAERAAAARKVGKVLEAAKRVLAKGVPPLRYKDARRLERKLTHLEFIARWESELRAAMK